MPLTPAERQSTYRARLKDPSLRPAPRDLTAPKACKTCGEVKPLETFRRSTHNADGHGPHCLQCANAIMRALKRRLRQENPEKARARGRAEARKWNANNLELNRERKRLSDARRRAADPAWKNASTRAWYAKNIERAREIKRKSELARRGRKHGAFIEKVAPKVVFERDGGICGICRQPVSPNERWHVDHVIPLSKGGEHSYANVQLAHARCNLVKHDSLPLRKAG